MSNFFVFFLTKAFYDGLIDRICMQISHEFERFSAYVPDVKIMVIFGGVNIEEHKKALVEKPPHIVVGTPGRIKAVRCAAPHSPDLENISRQVLHSHPPALPVLHAPCALRLYDADASVIAASCVFVRFRAPTRLRGPQPPNPRAAGALPLLSSSSLAT